MVQSLLYFPPSATHSWSLLRDTRLTLTFDYTHPNSKKAFQFFFARQASFFLRRNYVFVQNIFLKMPHVAISISWLFKTFWKMFLKEFLAGIRNHIIYTNVHKARPNRNRFWRQCNRICCVPQGPIKCKTTSPSIPGIYWASSAGYPLTLQQKTNRSGD